MGHANVRLPALWEIDATWGAGLGWGGARKRSLALASEIDCVGNEVGAGHVNVRLHLLRKLGLPRWQALSACIVVGGCGSVNTSLPTCTLERETQKHLQNK